MITKLSHERAEKKLKTCMNSGFRKKTDLTENLLAEKKFTDGLKAKKRFWDRLQRHPKKTLKKSLKKLLTKATKCDMINKSPNERTKVLKSDEGP